LGKSIFPLIDALDEWGEKNREIYEDLFSTEKESK
jgi:DNA-binding HxlR family transcriptional regulator